MFSKAIKLKSFLISSISTAMETYSNITFSMKEGIPQLHPNQISILSNNLLAERWARQKTYGYVPARFLDWNYRKKEIVRQFKMLKPDIACYQEVTKNTYKADLCDHLEGYQSAIQDKDIGNVIFWRDSKFKCTYQEMRSRAMFVELQSIEDESEVIYVANVHLEGFFHKPEQRFSQMKSLLQRISKRLKALKQEESETSLFIAGDFNCASSSGIHKLLIEGGLPACYKDSGNPVEYSKTALSHDYKLSSAYGKMEKLSELTFIVKGFKSDALDYIFYPQEQYEVVAKMRVMDKEDEEKIFTNSLPQEDHPSDHLPIAAVFVRRQ